MNNKFDEDLELLTKTLISTIPSLKEIRVFGSYETKKWIPESSDIDIMALLLDENLSCQRDRWIDEFYNINESPQRKKLRECVSKNLSQEFLQRLDLKLVTLSDMDKLIGLHEGRGDIGRNMYRGRVLYNKGWNMNLNQILKYCHHQLCLLKN